MRKISIKWRLALGFSLLVLLLIFVGITGWKGLYNTSEANEVSDNIRNAEKNLINASLNVMCYLKFNNDEFVDVAINGLDSAIYLMDMTNQMTGNRIVDAAKCKALMEEYKSTITRYVYLEKEKKNTFNEWHNLGVDISNDLASGKVYPGNNFLSQKMSDLNSNLRLSAWEFIANPFVLGEDVNTEATIKVEKNIEGCRSFINKNKVIKGIELDEQYKRYSTVFKSYTNFIKQQNGELLLMKKNSDEALVIYSQIVNQIKEYEKSVVEFADSSILLVGLMAIIFSVFLSYAISNSIIKPLDSIVSFSESLANGNLFHQLVNAGDDEITKLVLATNRMKDKLRDVVGEIMLGARQLMIASEQLNENSQQISGSTTEQAASLEEVSTAVEEMSANVEYSSENAYKGEEYCENTKSSIELVHAESKKAMEATKRIAEKISVIGDIASQTNILALNAAVESARAGAYGRGFAVVAAEVKRLAEKSKTAADEIVKLVQESHNLSAGANSKLEATLPGIYDADHLMKEIAASGTEQRSGANQINVAIQQLNQATQQNASSSEEMAASAEELSNQSIQLSNLISFFKLEKENECYVQTKSDSELKGIKKSFLSKKSSFTDLAPKLYDKQAEKIDVEEAYEVF